MALGGGKFTAMNKVLPGTYINFITQMKENYGIDLGIVALPLVLNWGKKADTITMSIDDWIGKCFEKLGYENDAPELLPLKEAFVGGATKILIYNLNNGVKAANEFATAKYEGIRGNDIKIKIATNVDDTSKFNVVTIVDNIDRDIQTVETSAELKGNDWVDWLAGTTLVETAATPLTGGTNGTITGTQHNNALIALEQQYFNVLVCDSTDTTTTNLYVNYTKRLRDAMGKDFQLVCYQRAADYEGVINVCTAVSDEGANVASLVYWIAGRSASRALGKSNTNTEYTGAFTPVCNETQSQLETAIEQGKFIMHRVGETIRVLMDINSLVTFTSEKSSIMAKNEVIRVTDYLNNSIANLFGNKYIGNVTNNADGRAHLKEDIMAIQDDLVMKGAIEYDSKEMTVTEGPDKGDVVIDDPIVVNAAMVRLYMTVHVN